MCVSSFTLSEFQILILLHPENQTTFLLLAGFVHYNTYDTRCDCATRSTLFSPNFYPPSPKKFTFIFRLHYTTIDIMTLCIVHFFLHSAPLLTSHQLCSYPYLLPGPFTFYFYRWAQYKRFHIFPPFDYIFINSFFP